MGSSARAPEPATPEQATPAAPAGPAATPARPRATPAGPTALRLPQPISSDEVVALVEACRRMWPTDHRIAIACVLDVAAEPCLATVDAIARLALAARDEGRGFELIGAAPALLELIEGCGLTQALGPGLRLARSAPPAAGRRRP